jgi:hypothetical protein
VDTFDTKYMVFKRRIGIELERQTQVWDVMNKRGNYPLGVIYWLGAWHQYVFGPLDGTEYNHGCLGEIAAFLTRLNSEHHTGKEPHGN